MGISYKKLWVLLIDRDIKKSSFRKELNLSSGTWTKLNKGEEVSLSILLRICGYLNCDIGDICEAVRTDNQSSQSKVQSEFPNKLWRFKVA